jgi:hypothetical protein
MSASVRLGTEAGLRWVNETKTVLKMDATEIQNGCDRCSFIQARMVIENMITDGPWCCFNVFYLDFQPIRCDEITECPMRCQNSHSDNQNGLWS